MGAITHNGDVLQGLPGDASQINYDNTSSGMAATQVQAAVDELKSGLTNVNSNIDSLEGRFGNQTYVKLGAHGGDNQNPVTVELSETYTNYDMVCFLISYYNDGVACYGYVAISSTIFKYFLSTDAGTPMYYHYNHDNTGCVRITKIDDTHIVFTPNDVSIGGNNCVVYGVKFNAEVTN